MLDKDLAVLYEVISLDPTLPTRGPIFEQSDNRSSKKTPVTFP
jgi:hypothetical protein